MSTEKHPLKAPLTRAEALLRNWPEAAKGDAYWEAQCKTIEQRLSSTSIGSTSDEILLSPMPTQPGEGLRASVAAGSAAAEQATAQPKPLGGRSEPGHLVDMARALAEKNRDDLREVARQGLSLAARSRSSARKHSVARAQAARAAPREPHAKETGSEARAFTPEALRPAASNRQSKRTASLYAAVAAGVIAAAAVVMLVATRPPATEAIRTPSAAEQGRLPASADPESDAKLEQTAAEQAKSSQSQVASGVAEPEREQQPASPEQHAKVRSPEPSPNQASTAPVKAKTSAGKSVRESRSVAAEAVTLDAKSKKSPGSQPPGQSGVDEKKLVPADAKRLTVSEKPSYGAAIAAVGAVLPSARSCLAGQNQGVPATVVFSSNGRVQSVSTGGPLAGSPAASCIAATLKRARVQPFARSTFSISISVRPP